MPENNSQSADEFYSAKQLQGEDLELDSSWRNKTPRTSTSSLASDVQARELAENDVVRDAFRKIKDILAEDDAPTPIKRQAPQRIPQMTMEDLNMGLPSSPPVGMDMDDLTSGLSAEDLTTLGLGIIDGIDSTAKQVFQDGYTGNGDELSLMAESNAGIPKQTTSEWRTEKAVARLKSGKQVPVWLVTNEGTGMKMEKPFRIQSPAEKIAAILNITGNVNDPRVIQIQEDYQRHVSLTKTLRNAKKAVKEGKSVNKTQYRKLMAELEGINHRLGI